MTISNLHQSSHNTSGETVPNIPEGRDITGYTHAAQELNRQQQEVGHFMLLSTMGEMASDMGMGLSISRSMIEANRGKLWIDWEHRTGASFSFELPVSAMQEGYEKKCVRKGLFFW